MPSAAALMQFGNVSILPRLLPPRRFDLAGVGGTDQILVISIETDLIRITGCVLIAGMVGPQIV